MAQAPPHHLTGDTKQKRTHLCSYSMVCFRVCSSCGCECRWARLSWLKPRMLLHVTLHFGNMFLSACSSLWIARLWHPIKSSMFGNLVILLGWKGEAGSPQPLGKEWCKPIILKEEERKGAWADWEVFLSQANTSSSEEPPSKRNVKRCLAMWPANRSFTSLQAGILSSASCQRKKKGRKIFLLCIAGLRVFLAQSKVWSFLGLMLMPLHRSHVWASFVVSNRQQADI